MATKKVKNEEVKVETEVMAEEVKAEEAKAEEVKAEAVEEVKEEAAEVKAIDKKTEALIEFIKAANINGMQLLNLDENNKIFRSFLPVEGQSLPMFIVLNTTVYTYIQVHLVTLTEEKQAKCVSMLNALNENFSMLKYFVNHEGNLVLTCSIPSGDDKFDPALVFALVDQVKAHLDENYPKLMAKIWEE